MDYKDRSLIQKEARQTREAMAYQAAYLATNQAFEAAKSRMNEARIAMELEDDPIKKARLAKIVEQYADEALVISDSWEREELRAVRRGRLTLWLLGLLFSLPFFPFNIILFFLFFIWWSRHYVFLRAEYKEVKAKDSKKNKVQSNHFTEMDEHLQTWLNQRITKLEEDRVAWALTVEKLVERIRSDEEIDFSILLDSYQRGFSILERYKEILADVERLPENENNREAKSHFTEMISEIKAILIHVEEWLIQAKAGE